jgi:acetyltransferase-like isoleucine patch superfamily enzyme
MSRSLLIQLLGMLLPAGIKRALFTSTLGWSIGQGTTIGLSIFLGCDQVKIGSDCRIGHFNMFRNLKRLEIRNQCKILNFNDFMAGTEIPDWPAALSIGNKTDVTSHHFFDCSGRITIGDFCCVGGRDSQLWTHFLMFYPDSQRRRTECRELSIGDRCYVGARATLVYCHIPNGCVVGAGAVVTRDFSSEGDGLLIAGNPAEVKKRLGVLEKERAS